MTILITVLALGLIAVLGGLFWWEKRELDQIERRYRAWLGEGR